MNKALILISGAMLSSGAAVAAPATPVATGAPEQSINGEVAPCAAAAVSLPRGRKLDGDDPCLSERACKLIRIGEDAIEKHNEEAIDAYFAPDMVFHGPTGELNREQLKAVQAAFRASYANYRVTRQAIVEQGDFIAARTTMSGTFVRAVDTPFGRMAPTGRHVEWEINNVFRYDANGRLVEEWVQYDTLGFMRQLGVDLQARDADDAAPTGVKRRAMRR
ncbi:ester cyclase [Massilia sp. CMS3.1]|uniref:ester cyclase n=1 Tax=Massilia sp. CMS3.1 TaxID=3373083 RepID=UPI003EE7896C